jgi:AcrR family transcriptional regulator
LDNRRLILSEALRLFSARGYDAVSVQEIAQAAGVTKPTLYHYFGSKHGLLSSLLAEHFHPFHADLQQAAVYGGDLPRTLSRLVKAYFEFAQQKRPFYRMHLSMWFAPPKSETYQAVVPYIREQRGWIEAMFIQAVQDHGNLRGHHKAYAITLLGMINNYIAFSQAENAELNEDLVHQAVKQFMYGIFAL